MKCMTFFALVFLPSVVLTSRHWQEEGHTVIRECLVTFSIVNAGIDVTGSIDSVSVTSNLDLDNLAQSTIVASADPTTIRTGIAIRDRHLVRSDYFDVATYPTIQIRSTALRRTGQRSFVGQFDLTIKGITRSVTIPFTLKRERGMTHYSGSFTINRLDFSLGEESFVLGDTVIIHIRVTAG